MSQQHDDNGASRQLHWLYRRETLPKLWLGGCALLAFTLALEVFVNLHPHFGFADWFSFTALYGFFTCLLMVLFAKGLAHFVKRPDDYYEPDESAHAQPAPGSPIDEELQ